jgi:tetratricopeptide (TPR) repeat protein
MESEGIESYSADKWKELGNNAFKEKNWIEAKNCFTKAIELNPDNEIFYSNRSAAELFLRSYDDALKDAGMHFFLP